MKLAFDSNIFYRTIEDCRFSKNPGKCKRMKELALASVSLGKVHGCVILPTVEKEVRRTWIEEIAPFCERKSVIDESKIESFVNKLIKRAEEDEKFLEVCTSQGRDRFERIYKAMKGDWRILAESIENGAILVTFDRNLTDPYCVRVYEEVAKDVGFEGEVKVVKPSELLKKVLEVER